MPKKGFRRPSLTLAFASILFQQLDFLERHIDLFGNSGISFYLRSKSGFVEMFALRLVLASKVQNNFSQIR